MAVQPLSPATDRRLGGPVPHQLPNRTRVHLSPIKSLIAESCGSAMLCGISVRFQTLSPCERQVTHALLTRPPLNLNFIQPKSHSIKVPFDLHVLGTSPAFILSQDQTLILKYDELVALIYLTLFFTVVFRTFVRLNSVCFV